MELNAQAMKALLDAFDRSDWQEMTVTVGGDSLRVSRQATGDGAAAPAPTAPGPEAAAPGAGTVVSSPSVGLFWRAPSPGAPAFVEVGAHVAAGETVAIVEVMKLMSHVSAPVAGVVTAIMVENGATVEYGEPLITIDPEG